MTQHVCRGMQHTSRGTRDICRVTKYTCEVTKFLNYICVDYYLNITFPTLYMLNIKYMYVFIFSADGPPYGKRD